MKKYMAPEIEYVEVSTPDIMAFSVEGRANFENATYNISEDIWTQNS